MTQIYDFVLSYRRLKMREIAQPLQMTARVILHKYWAWQQWVTRVTREQSKQRTLRGGRVPKKAKNSLFWDSQDVIFIGYI